MRRHEEPLTFDSHTELRDAFRAPTLPLGGGDADSACRDLVSRLGRDGLLVHSGAGTGGRSTRHWPGTLRIYEGASDVQRVIIARQALGGRR